MAGPAAYKGGGGGFIAKLWHLRHQKALRTGELTPRL